MVFIYLATWLFFLKKGGWEKADPSDRSTALVVVCACTGCFVLWCFKQFWKRFVIRLTDDRSDEQTADGEPALTELILTAEPQSILDVMAGCPPFEVTSPSHELNALSLLGAEAVGLAQRLRRETLGDAGSALRNLEQAEKNDPAAHLFLMFESCHLQMAQALSRLRFSVARADERNQELEEYYQALVELVDLYNKGLQTLRAGIDQRRRTDLGNLLRAVGKEINQCNKIYSGNRL
jgi:hypothetical protein